MHGLILAVLLSQVYVVGKVPETLKADRIMVCQGAILVVDKSKVIIGDKEFADPELVKAILALPFKSLSCRACNVEKTLACPKCKGKFQSVLTKIPCKKSALTGCSGTGLVNCFTCRGTGQSKCTGCNGKGYIKRWRTTSDYRGNRRRESYRWGCQVCYGTKHSKCVKCANGKITCPRCNGTGEYEKRGKCPNCTKGKVDCPDCET